MVNMLICTLNIYNIIEVELYIIKLNMVPMGRLELPRPCDQRILSPQRLPIPPHGQRTT